MKRPKLLVLVRHAESMRNRAKANGGGVYFTDDDSRRAVKGIPDHKIPLTPEGREQAVRTGIGLERDFGPFDYVYHSGYQRTIETMGGILAAYSEEERARMLIRENSFIRERHSGYTYEMTKEEAEAAFPWLKGYWETFGSFFAQPPGGESLADVVQRVYTFINMLFNDRAGDNVLAVTHGGTLRCFRYLLEHWGYDQALAWAPGEEPKNCGVTIYRFDQIKKKLLLEEYNRVYY